MDVVSLLISLVSGGVGGNIGGAVSKGTSMGPTLNTILGGVGGLLGGQVLGHSSALEGLGMGGNIGSSAIIGLLLPLIIGFIKNKMAGPR